MKNLNITKNQMKGIISLHESMGGSYFWSPPYNRESYEKNNSLKIEGNYKNHLVSLECDTRCSRRNIYYKGYFYIDGERRTIAAVKKLVK